MNNTISDIELEKQFVSVLQEIEILKDELALKATGANVHKFMSARDRLFLAVMNRGRVHTRFNLASLKESIKSARRVLAGEK